jgi:hypothetical protein
MNVRSAQSMLKHAMRYREWLKGQADRFDRKSCASVNGDYLDGFYSPEKTFPDFLTNAEAARCRAIMASLPRN